MTRTTSNSSLPSDNEEAVIVLAKLNSSNSEPSSTNSPSSASNVDDESSFGGPDSHNDELNNTVRLKPIIKRLYSSSSLSTHKKRPPRCVRFDKRRPQTMEMRDWRIGMEDIMDGSSSTSIFCDKNNGGLNVGSETTREIQRASVVIGFIASVFFFLCITLVGMALYYTPELDKLANGKGVEAKTVMASIPSYVSMSQKVGGDDSNIQYDSLLSSHDAKRRYSERPPVDALEAKHREKLFQLARKGVLSDSDLRLEQWLLEKKGGRLIPPRRSSRAQSHQGVGLLAPDLTRSSSKRSTKSSLAAINTGDPRRRSSENPSHSRPSKTVLSDFEAAEILEAVLDAQKEDYAGSPPPEKERRRIVILVSVFALVLTFLAAGMVGLTFGLEEFHGKSIQKFNRFYFNSRPYKLN